MSFDTVIRFEKDRIGSVEVGAPWRADGPFPDTLCHACTRQRARSWSWAEDDCLRRSRRVVQLWVPATYTLPRIDPYAVAAVAFARMARSGITFVHCHLSGDRTSLLAAAGAVRRAARDVGIRVAFVVPMRDRHRLGYGPDEAVLACSEPEDRAAIAERWLRPLPSIPEQLDLVEEIADAEEEAAFSVQYGPVGAEWCSDDLLEAVAARSADTGRRVHMHLLESRYQREWADRQYGEGVVGRLRTIGLASPRLTVAHGTWLRPDECEALASAGVMVSVNTSSNLRLSSGIASLGAMKAAGLRTGLGLDALALDDDDDMLREIRLTHLLIGVGGSKAFSTPAISCRLPLYLVLVPFLEKAP